jgi:hypothetical protein
MSPVTWVGPSVRPARRRRAGRLQTFYHGLDTGKSAGHRRDREARRRRAERVRPRGRSRSPSRGAAPVQRRREKEKERKKGCPPRSSSMCPPPPLRVGGRPPNFMLGAGFRPICPTHARLPLRVRWGALHRGERRPLVRPSQADVPLQRVRHSAHESETPARLERLSSPEVCNVLRARGYGLRNHESEQAAFPTGGRPLYRTNSREGGWWSPKMGSPLDLFPLRGRRQRE